MNTTKNILIFYFIVLMCLSVSAIGMYFLNEEIAKIYLGASFTITPLITIIEIIRTQSKSKP